MILHVLEASAKNRQESKHRVVVFFDKSCDLTLTLSHPFVVYTNTFLTSATLLVVEQYRKIKNKPKIQEKQVHRDVKGAQ